MASVAAITGACAAARRLLPRVVVLAALFTAACASAPNPADSEAYAEYEATNDPLEPLNRGIYGFNNVLDLFVFRPAAGFYRGLVPPPVQTGVTNFLRNLRSPVVLINDLLQGEFDRAGTTTARFFINTIGGVGGLYDLASDFGLDYHGEDFGQTLAVWGVPDGPFLMLPLIGPSSPRDAVGLAVDTFVFDPFTWWVRANPDDRDIFQYTRMGLTVLSERARNFDELEDIRKTSLDPYATLRSLYRQFRRGQINQGVAEPLPMEGPSLDEIDPDLAAPEPLSPGKE